MAYQERVWRTVLYGGEGVNPVSRNEQAAVAAGSLRSVGHVDGGVLVADCVASSYAGAAAGANALSDLLQRELAWN